MEENEVLEAEQSEQTEEQDDKDWKAEAERWKARSRDWEKQSKANKKAADELAAIKAESMTEQEQAIARAEAAEKELEQLKAEAEHRQAAEDVSAETGVPIAMLKFCADEDAMREFAEMYTEKTPTVHSAPRARSSAVVKGGEKPQTAADQFAEFAEDFFRK